MKFDVTITLPSGEEIDVRVDVDAGDGEMESLRYCVQEQLAIETDSYLEGLVEEIREEALSCAGIEIDDEDDEEIDDDEEDDADSDSEDDEIMFDISISDPDELEPDEPEMDDYIGYPFAMEVVNGEIISLTTECQRKIVDTLLAKTGRTEEQLADRLRRAMNADSDDEPDEDDPIADLLARHDADELAEVFGFDEESGEFAAFDIGFLDSTAGWTAKELLEDLDIPTEEDLDEGPHGHGTTGVIFIDTL